MYTCKMYYNFKNGEKLNNNNDFAGLCTKLQSQTLNAFFNKLELNKLYFHYN